MMESIDETFAKLVGGLQIEEATTFRYVKRVDGGFSNNLPLPVLENLAELAVLAAVIADRQEPPRMYEEEVDQEAYRILSSGVLAESARTDAAHASEHIFERSWGEETVLSLLRMMNVVKTALTSSVRTPEDLQNLRQVNPAIGQILDLLAAVQHELLEALM